jgi:hypothetical protein
MITITEVTGNENISLARLTYNNNFLLIENEINELEDVFNINLNTGSLDCSTAVGGEIKAKTIAANQISLPVSSPAITLFGVSGSISGSGTLSFAGLSISGTGSISNLNATGATFSTRAFFGGTASFGNIVQYGSGARVVNSNVAVNVGVTGGTNLLVTSGGVTGSYSNPYAIDGTQKIIYAKTDLVDGGFTGFFMRVSPTGTSGSTAANLPSGYTITIVSTSATGTIPSGVTGNITGSAHFYTGLNSTLFSGITMAGTERFKSSITLMWEPKINQGVGAQEGSWIVLNSTNNITY